MKKQLEQMGGKGPLVDQVIGAVPKSQLETKFKQHAA
jgi:hypothetical protein